MSSSVLQQVLLGSASAGLLVMVHRFARRRSLEFELAVGWSSVAALGLLSVAIIPSVDTLGSAVGLAPGAVLTAAAATVLASIALALSVRASRAERDLQSLTESLAISNLKDPPPPADRPESVLALVPAWNEARSIASVVHGLRLQGLPVLVVDDGSHDGTAEAAREAGAAVLELPVNLGVGGALRAGLRVAIAAGYSRVAQCDADGQHPPDQVKMLVGLHASAHCDMLVGSRFAEDRARRPGLVRSFAMLVLARSASRATGTRITDASSGMRVISQPLLSELARAMPRHYLGDTYEVLIAAGRAGYLVREASVSMQARQFGESSAGFFAATRFTVRAVSMALVGAQVRLKPVRAL